jgi:superfamily I DNA and/or RNA helicase
VKVLNKRHKVSTSCIAVLTPYSAQKNLIEEKMKEAKLDKIKVASITESQGEVWHASS